MTAWLSSRVVGTAGRHNVARVGVRLLLWLGVFLVAAAATASGARGATPTVIVQAPAPITSIATSSGSLVWRQVGSNPSGRICYTAIKRRTWRSGAVTTVVSCRGLVSYGDFQGWHDDMAMGTSTVVFTNLDDQFNCCTDRLIVTLHTSAAATLDSSHHMLTCGGDQIINLVAHGGVAAYTKSEWAPIDPGTDCSGGNYLGGESETMTGGPVMTLALPSGKPRALTGAPPARFLDLTSGRLALVPYDVAAAPMDAFPPPKPEIQLWNLSKRVRERTIAETGVIRALAMRGDLIAVLVDGGAGNLRIDRFSASTSAPTGTTAVPANTAPMLAIYYRWVVYVAGKTVVGLNTDNGSMHTIATPTYAPRQILAVHGSAVWSALAQGRGRIVAAPLP